MKSHGNHPITAVLDLPTTSCGAVPSWNKLRHWLKIAGINVALLLLGIVVIELAFGRWFVGYVAPDPRLLGRAFSFPQTLYEPHGDVSYVRDEYGLRTLQQPVSSVQLVTVGGSTTAQMFVSDGQTWQDVIQQRTGIVIANAGVDGMATQSVNDVLDDWLFQIPELKAKYFLHYIGINDATMAQTMTIAERKRRYSWSRRIWGRSTILQAFSRLRGMLQGPHMASHSAMQPDAAPKFEPARTHVDLEKIHLFVDKFYKSNIRRLLELHRSKGQTVILVTQAFSPALVRYEGSEVMIARPELGRWAVALDAVNAATRSVCRDHPDHCRVIDLAREISFDRADFYDLAHNTPQGTRKIGEYLAGKLPPLLDAPPR